MNDNLSKSPRFIPRPIVPKAPILSIYKEKVLGVDVTRERIYISRVTETTILTVDSDLHETLWRRDNGKIKKHISLSTDWYIPQTALDALEDYLSSNGPVHAGRHVYSSGFRPRFNDKGIEVFDVPPLNGEISVWLSSMGFQIFEV